jgi:hypothetical protein
VTFDESLEACVAVGTIGSPGFRGHDTGLYADVGEPDENSVTVEIRHLGDDAGTPPAPADNSVQLARFR